MSILVGSRQVRTKQWKQNLCDTIPGKNELFCPEFDPALDGISFGGHCTTGSQATSINDQDGKDLNILLYIILKRIVWMILGKTTGEGLSQGSNGHEI